jgi:hypothetical protein
MMEGVEEKTMGGERMVEAVGRSEEVMRNGVVGVVMKTRRDS